jgi:hypothetical protein
MWKAKRLTPQRTHGPKRKQQAEVSQMLQGTKETGQATGKCVKKGEKYARIARLKALWNGPTYVSLVSLGRKRGERISHISQRSG